MKNPTAAEIQAIRERRAECATATPWYWSEDNWRGGYSGLYDGNGEPIIRPDHANDGDDGAAWFSAEGLTDGNREFVSNAPTDIDALLAALDAVNDRLKRAQAAIRFTLASEVYDFDLVEGCESLCKALQDEEAWHAATQQKLDIATTEASIRKRRVEIGCELASGLRSQLNAAKSENKTLRTCFCIADDETVVSSVEGSVLIDNKSGSRRRYFTATDEERTLKEQLDAVTAERDGLAAQLLDKQIALRDPRPVFLESEADPLR